jgi:hypothetical protein
MVKRHNVVKSNDIVVGGLTEVRTQSVYGPCEARDASPMQVPEG